MQRARVPDAPNRFGRAFYSGSELLHVREKSTIAVGAASVIGGAGRQGLEASLITKHASKTRVKY